MLLLKLQCKYCQGLNVSVQALGQGSVAWVSLGGVITTCYLHESIFKKKNKTRKNCCTLYITVKTITTMHRDQTDRLSYRSCVPCVYSSGRAAASAVSNTLLFIRLTARLTTLANFHALTGSSNTGVMVEEALLSNII